MNTVLRLMLLSLLTAALPLWAAFESISVEVTEEPQMPAALRMNGLTNGKVIIAIDVGPDAKLLDWLVISASHRELIKPCIEVLQNWRYTPARYEGQAVQAQLLLSIDISQSSAVVSQTLDEAVNDLIEKSFGRQPDYQAWPASAIDRQPAVITAVAPRYSAEAEQLGVRGRVKVHFYIDEKGEVRMPAVPAESDPYLATVAIAALKGWKFEPPTRQGRPVLVAASQEFSFGGL